MNLLINILHLQIIVIYNMKYMGVHDFDMITVTNWFWQKCKVGLSGNTVLLNK